MLIRILPADFLNLINLVLKPLDYRLCETDIYDNANFNLSDNRVPNIPLVSDFLAQYPVCPHFMDNLPGNRRPLAPHRHMDVQARGDTAVHTVSVDNPKEVALDIVEFDPIRSGPWCFCITGLSILGHGTTLLICIGKVLGAKHLSRMYYEPLDDAIGDTNNTT